MSTSGQMEGPCVTPLSFGAAGTPCSGIIIGQTFESSATGWLESISIFHCTASNTQVSLRRIEHPSQLFASPVIYTSEVYTLSNPTGTCVPNSNQAIDYAHLTIQFDQNQVALEQGQLYLIEFTAGSGAAACEGDVYSEGMAFSPYGALINQDLPFTIELCEDNMVVFGCTDDSPGICNFDPQATTDDGSCLLEDCMGTCGGTATLVEGCGCVGGSSELQIADCYGCTDPAACNFSETTINSATWIPPFDDGSCLQTDCHGDCGGSAVLTACGCIGGNTGNDASCIDGCIASVTGTTEPSCLPVFLKGEVFSPQTSGVMKEVRIASCCAGPTQFTIRRVHPEYVCSPALYWNQGEVLYESGPTPPTCGSFIQCISSAGYSPKHWSTPDIPLIAGEHYVVELSQGLGVASCTPSSIGLQSFDLYGSSNAASLAWELVTCDDPVNFGCTDPSAPNHSPIALYDDGTCDGLDCAGNLNGTSEFHSGCGCLDNDDGQASIACHDGHLTTLIESQSASCSGYASHRDWTAPYDGFLTAIQIEADSTEAIDIQLTYADGPLQTTLVASASHTARTPIHSCDSPDDDWLDFHFDSVPIQAGRTYRIESTETNLLGSCDSPSLTTGEYTSNDQAIQANIRLAMIPDDDGIIVWGCQDVTKCNYNPLATYDSGECYDFDCLGQCPDIVDYVPAEFIPGCGCAGGPDSLKTLDATQCEGCMDQTACNFNPTAVFEAIGACNFPDCNGDCLESDPTQSGLATFDPVCGCIGGNTDPELLLTCNARCSGSVRLSNFPEFQFQWGNLLGEDAVQSIEIQEDFYLSGLRLLHLGSPADFAADPFTIEIAVLEGNTWDPAANIEVLDAISYTPSPLNTLFGLYEVFFSVEETLPLQPGQNLLIRLASSEWNSPTTSGNSIDAGFATVSSGSNVHIHDLHLELYGCDDLYGCTDPSACTFNDWATLLLEGSCSADCDDPSALNYTPFPNVFCTNNSYCEFLVGCTDPLACNYLAGAIDVHPYSGEVATCILPDPQSCDFCPEEFPDPTQMSENDLVRMDTDQDGICDGDEVAGCLNPTACNFHDSATDPAPCTFANDCGECSGHTDGTGYLIVSNDVDGDGICDDLDLCANVEADNYASPLNEPCRGTCDTAPIADTAFVVSLASGRFVGDGRASVLWTHGNMPGMTSADTEVGWVEFIGINDDQFHSIPVDAGWFDLTPGYYSVVAYDPEGCPWVSTTLHGSTFQQPATSLSLFIPYTLCCGDCSNHDLDTDGICDASDNCTDRLANNYSDSNNPPCTYPE